MQHWTVRHIAGSSRRELLGWLSILPLAAAAGRFVSAGGDSEEFHIVDGWVLTANDLKELRRHAG